MAISNYILSTSPANIFVSSGGANVISTMHFCNNHDNTVILNVYALPNGQTVANTNNRIYANLQITSGDTYVVDMEKIVLGNGDKIAASASNADVMTATISYVGV
jgi:hypothetical protein